MAGAYTARRVDRSMQLHGTAMTLKRKTLVDLAVKGKAIGSSDEDTGNTAAQSQRVVRISNAEIAAASDSTRAPARGDSITVDGSTLKILHVDTKKDGGVTVMHVLTAVG